MTFANIRNNQIIDFNSLYLDKDIQRVETTEDIYKAYLEDTSKVIYQDGEVILNPNYEEEQAQKERERIAQLYLTGADVERGIYQAKGMDFDDILAYVTQLQPEGLDIKALKIELKANNFYRGNPYVSAIGALLGFTDKQLDLFFEYNNYWHLLTNPEPAPSDPKENQAEIELEPTDDPSLTQEEPSEETLIEE